MNQAEDRERDQQHPDGDAGPAHRFGRVAHDGHCHDEQQDRRGECPDTYRRPYQCVDERPDRLRRPKPHKGDQRGRRDQQDQRERVAAPVGLGGRPLAVDIGLVDNGRFVFTADSRHRADTACREAPYRGDAVADASAGGRAV